MTRKLTPAQLDEIEAAARALITAQVTPPSTSQLGHTLREWEAFNKAATPINVLALICDLRDGDAMIERVRALHEPYGCSEPGCIDGCAECESEYGWPCDTIKALGEEA